MWVNGDNAAQHALMDAACRWAINDIYQNENVRKQQKTTKAKNKWYSKNVIKWIELCNLLNCWAGELVNWHK